MWSLLRRSRYLLQYRRIVTILTRHGLGWLADRAGLSRLLSWPRRLFRREPRLQPLPSLVQRLCRALEEMGPTFILLGRYLGTRVDLLPTELRQELSCICPAGPTMSAEEVAQVLEEALGRPPEELFAVFEVAPWRRTWLAQTHLARTGDGREVWVTLRSEALRSQTVRDMPALLELARLADEHRPEGRWWSAAEVVQQFDEALRQGFDMREQGRNAERWRRQFAGGGPAFPEVDWERTAAAVLTCQALAGRALGAAAAQPEEGDVSAGAGPAGRELAGALYRFFGQAIFTDGFYPAPPDLGGLLVLGDGRLAVTSLAPAAYLDDTLRRHVLRLLELFVDERVEGMIGAAAALGMIELRQVSAALYQAVRHLIERYHGLPLAEVRLEELAADILALAGRRVIVLPEELSLLLRTLVLVEGLGQSLAPGVSATEEVAPVVRRAMAALHSWSARQERLVRAGRDWLEALGTLPVDVDQLLSQAIRGDLSLGVEPRGWRRPMRRLERMVYRLVLSVVAAGMLVALALLITALLPAAWGPWGWVLAGLACFSLLGMGFFLLLSFRRRHM